MPFSSVVDYQTVATLETFGFLPAMTQEEIYELWQSEVRHTQ